jgi:hypothetical protein
MSDPIELLQRHRKDIFVLAKLGRVVELAKSARILAVEMHENFTIETDRGVMTGVPGDYVVTNHPDDDPGSDMWSISAERMANTYRVVR